MSHSAAKSPKGQPIRIGIRFVGAIILFGTIGLWIGTGAHTGFSKNRVEVPMLDPITEIEYVDYEERFVMGLEYLAAGSFGGLGLMGVAGLFGRKQ